jgi:hypothetical protein
MIDPLEIQAFADGELSAEDQARVGKLIASDEQASAKLLELQSLKSCLQSKTEKIDSEDVWSRCVSRLDEMDRTKRVEGFVAKYAWGLCSLFFLVILAGGLFNRMNRHTVGTAEVATYVAGLGPSSGSLDPKVAQTEKALRVLLKDIQSSQATGRAEVIRQREGLTRDGRPVVCFDMRDAKGFMSLLLISGVATIEDLEPIEGTDGMAKGMIGRSNCVTWTDDGNALVLIGDRSYKDLRATAERIRITSYQ